MSTSQTILTAVQDQYGAVARSSLSNESAAVRSVAEDVGDFLNEVKSLVHDVGLVYVSEQRL